MLLFFVFSAAICSLVGYGLTYALPLRPQFVNANTAWLLGGILFSLWALVSVLSFVEYAKGIGPAASIYVTAGLGAPIATAVFVSMWPTATSYQYGWILYTSVVALVLVSAIIGLLSVTTILKVSEAVEDKMYPIFVWIDL